MHESDDYIKELWERLKSVEDKELLVLVKKLIDERNYLTEIANIDALTGLNNRRALKRVREFSGVLMMDVDNFKTINDTFGHDVGDRVLKSVGSILKTHTRAKDYTCRFGGDEFCIVFVDCNEDIIKNRAEAIRKTILTSIRVPNLDHEITVSIGYSYKPVECSLEEAMKEADVALYKSKEAGKNRITAYSNDLPTLKFTREE